MYSFVVHNLTFVCFNLLLAWISASSGGLLDNYDTRIPKVVPLRQLYEARTAPITQSFLTTYPTWVNQTLLAIGQKFLRDNFYSYIYSVILAGGVIVNPDIIRILIGEGNITNHVAAKKRYLSNNLHINYWSKADLSKDQDNLFESLNLVHAMHNRLGHTTYQKRAKYSQAVIPEPEHGQNPYNINLRLWKAFEKDLRNSRLKAFGKKQPNLSKSMAGHLPLNQFTFAGLLWVFVYGTIVKPENIYIYKAKEEELMGFLHFWAFIGYAVGVHDKYNICFQPNLPRAKWYLTEMYKMYILPSLFQSDYEHKVSVETSILALQVFPLTNNIGSYLLRVCEDILEIQCPKLQASVDPKTRFYNMMMGPFAHQLLRTTPGKSFFIAHQNDILQKHALHHFKFNTLAYENYTAGIIELGEKVIWRY